MHRSLAQNEVLFSSEGLTLLSLDHLYTFKAALASYVHTQSPRRLEDAVDELRRLVLSQGRQKLRKSALLGAYAWLGPVSDGALRDVSRMYARAYGGDAGQGGVEDDVDGEHPASWRFPHRPATVVVHHHLNEMPLPALPTDSDKPDEPDEPSSGSRSRSGSSSTTRSRRSCRELEKRFCIDFDFDMEIEEYYRERAREVQAEEAAAAAEAEAEAEAALLEEMRRTTPKMSPPPPPKMPVLRLQTTFERRPTGVLKPVPLKKAAGAEGVEGAAGETGEAEVEMPGGGAVEAPGQQEGEEEGEGEEQLRDEEEEEELTARPKSGHPNTLAAGLGRWNSMTIDEIINDMESKRTSDAGPMTPNGYDDISPITRGEWGFLMVSDGWKGKTAAVEMC